MYNGSVEDFFSLWNDVYHTLTYETIDGYSLGHEVTFHASLEKAKISFPACQMPKREYQFFQTNNHSSKDAILELELDKDNKIVALGKLYKLEFEPIYEKAQAESDYFKKYFKPLWVSGALDPNEVTTDALNELTRQYQLSELCKVAKDEPIVNSLSH